MKKVAAAICESCNVEGANTYLHIIIGDGVVGEKILMILPNKILVYISISQYDFSNSW